METDRGKAGIENTVLFFNKNKEKFSRETEFLKKYSKDLLIKFFSGTKKQQEEQESKLLNEISLASKHRFCLPLNDEKTAIVGTENRDFKDVVNFYFEFQEFFTPFKNFVFSDDISSIYVTVTSETLKLTGYKENCVLKCIEVIEHEESKLVIINEFYCIKNISNKDLRTAENKYEFFSEYYPAFIYDQKNQFVDFVPIDDGYKNGVKNSLSALMDQLGLVMLPDMNVVKVSSCNKRKDGTISENIGSKTFYTVLSLENVYNSWNSSTTIPDEEKKKHLKKRHSVRGHIRRLIDERFERDEFGNVKKIYVKPHYKGPDEGVFENEIGKTYLVKISKDCF